MKALPLLISLIFNTLCVFAQTGRQVDDDGNLLYQYQRTAILEEGNPHRVVVDFIFINGVEPRAISYRQEKLNSVLQWIRNEKGDLREENCVESLTANLQPCETVRWQFAFEKTKVSTAGVPVEKAALMILNEEGVVEKILFDENLCK